MHGRMNVSTHTHKHVTENDAIMYSTHVKTDLNLRHMFLESSSTVVSALRHCCVRSSSIQTIISCCNCIGQELANASLEDVPC